MIALPKKLYHAIEAVLYVAYNAGSGPIAGRDIAARQGLPPRYLEQLMQKMVRAGVLKSMRGPRGGYVLAREKRRISMGDICQALAGQEEYYTGTKLGSLVILPAWQLAHATLMTELQAISLAALCEQAEAKHVKKAAQEKMDFTI